MANTVSILSYNNTFGDWMVSTNALAKENNDLAANNYIKTSGTLFLNSNTLGLQVANNSIFGGQFQVQGIGSSAYIQNNLRVDTQVYFTNTTIGLINSGQANIGGLLLATGSGTGLNVYNNAVIGGSATIGTNASIGNNLVVSKNTTTNNITSTYNTSTNTLLVSDNASVGNNITITNTSYTNSLQANNIVLTQTLNAVGSSFLNIVQANTSVSTDTISVANSSFLNIVQANTVQANTVQANTSVSTPLLTVINTLDATTANGVFNTIHTVGELSVGGQLSVGGNFVIHGSTVFNTTTFTLNADSTVGLPSYFSVNRGISGANSSIRWNETSKYWDIMDVSNSTYYRILTNQNLSDSISTANSTIIATSQAANTLNENIKTSNTWLQANDALTLSSAKTYADGLISVIQANNALFTSNVWLQANDALTLSSAKSYSDVANTWLQANDAITLSSAKSYTVTTVNTANTWLQANDALTLSSAKSYTDTTVNTAKTSTHFIGTTSIALNRASATQALTGITSIDGTASGLSATLAVGSGGTGLISPGTSGNVLTSTGAGWTSSPAPISLPTQTGNTGRYLTTDGSTASWSTVSSGSTFPSQTGNAGKFLATDGTNVTWQITLPTQTGNTGKYLITNGTTASWSTPSTLPTQTGNTGRYLITDGTTASWATVTSGVSLTGVESLSNKTLVGPVFQAYQEKVVTIGSIATSTYTIDTSLANIFDLTLTASTTITFSNVAASGFARPITLIVRQPAASASKTLAVTGAKYTDGVAPVLSTGVSQIDVLTYWSPNGGATFFGTFAMANVS